LAWLLSRLPPCWVWLSNDVLDGRGLAVYFWLRLGYRPLTTAQAPWPLAGLSNEPRRGLWMVRDGQ